MVSRIRQGECDRLIGVSWLQDWCVDQAGNLYTDKASREKWAEIFLLRSNGKVLCVDYRLQIFILEKLVDEFKYATIF